MGRLEAVSGADRFAFLDTLKELPSLPQVLVRISRVASNPKSSAAELSDVILRDQALTLRILRIANSARYALYSQRVTTVSRSVMLLGFQSVRAIALGLGAYNLLSALEKGGKVLEGFWKEAMACAVICQELAGFYNLAVSEEAFVAGLLHDMGKLVLTERDPVSAARIYGGDFSGRELLAAERAAFDVDHTEVAGELARRWELPDVLQRAMTNHHRHFPSPPADRGDMLAFLVSAAKTLAMPLCSGDGAVRDLAPNMARVLRKPVGPLLRLLEGLPAKISEYADFFEIEVTDLKAYTLWVEEENRRLTDVFSQQEDERRLVESRKAEIAAVREVHALLVQGGGPDAPIRRALRTAREAAGSRRTVLALADRSLGELRQSWSDGDTAPGFLDAFRFPLAEDGVVTEVFRSGQVVHVFDIQMPYFRRLLNTRELKVIDASSFVCLPVRRGTEPMGVLYADRADGDDPFRDEEVEILCSVADLVSLALRG